MFIVLLIFLTAMSMAAAAPPEINVIYPERGAIIGAADSTFIFGSVSPEAQLTINNYSVKVHKDGGFLAYLPLESGEFIFKISAVNGDGTGVLLWPVIVPKPDKSLPYDNLAIIDRSLANGDMILAAGDFLPVEMKATPGCRA
jgi:N-acetylmuramoyl-L-alanine amidase